jgi:hypothetical protein
MSGPWVWAVRSGRGTMSGVTTRSEDHGATTHAASRERRAHRHVGLEGGDRTRHRRVAARVAPGRHGFGGRDPPGQRGLPVRDVAGRGNALAAQPVVGRRHRKRSAALHDLGRRSQPGDPRAPRALVGRDPRGGRGAARGARRRARLEDVRGAAHASRDRRRGVRRAWRGADHLRAGRPAVSGAGTRAAGADRIAFAHPLAAAARAADRPHLAARDHVARALALRGRPSSRRQGGVAQGPRPAARNRASLPAPQFHAAAVAPPGA